MTARFFVPVALPTGQRLALPADVVRHVQVLRLQPGDMLVLFNGRGGESPAHVESMARGAVTVVIGDAQPADRELALAVTLAIGMPANDRMDTLVEKAVELGVAAIQPLVCERSVLRLSGERAPKKQAHWQAVAIAACEQSGRTRIPSIAPVRALADWLGSLAEDGVQRLLLSLADAGPLPPAGAARVLCLSGPEGGLAPAEEQLARARGFVPVSLGPRVLRADTAPLALLAHLGLR